ncbi:MAG: HupE/UreJ family protein [Myxococcales bacterium FL481]|nr:MAG: HupE/UreJ family protein [Myxococcales bacterium FL481]
MSSDPRASSTGGSRRARAPLSTLLARYVALGFEHILPLGLDHILFVMGLFFASPHLGALAAQVTAFTLAHSLTLVLSALGVWSIPTGVVEPLIALSIVFVALENTIPQDKRKGRLLTIFAFGLLHGLGFASVLLELGLPSDRLVWALGAFNLGVELGQLAVLVSLWLLLRPLRERDWYRTTIAVPASVAIAAVGLYWFVERVWF